uniref:Uncharacterized protein n=1 Tax=Arundo donax TaxID=35708 RepID=A0A0A9HDW4_ARUDO
MIHESCSDKMHKSEKASSTKHDNNVKHSVQSSIIALG